MLGVDDGVAVRRVAGVNVVAPDAARPGEVRLRPVPSVQGLAVATRTGLLGPVPAATSALGVPHATGLATVAVPRHLRRPTVDTGEVGVVATDGTPLDGLLEVGRHTRPAIDVPAHVAGDDVRDALEDLAVGRPPAVHGADAGAPDTTGAPPDEEVLAVHTAGGRLHDAPLRGQVGRALGLLALLAEIVRPGRPVDTKGVETVHPVGARETGVRVVHTDPATRLVDIEARPNAVALDGANVVQDRTTGRVPPVPLGREGVVGHRAVRVPRPRRRRVRAQTGADRRLLAAVLQVQAPVATPGTPEHAGDAAPEVGDERRRTLRETVTAVQVVAPGLVGVVVAGPVAGPVGRVGVATVHALHEAAVPGVPATVAPVAVPRPLVPVTRRPVPVTAVPVGLVGGPGLPLETALGRTVVHIATLARDPRPVPTPVVPGRPLARDGGHAP